MIIKINAPPEHVSATRQPVNTFLPTLLVFELTFSAQLLWAFQILSELLKILNSFWIPIWVFLSLSAVTKPEWIPLAANIWVTEVSPVIIIINNNTILIQIKTKKSQNYIEVKMKIRIEAKICGESYINNN